jgi:hypothetical protein
VALDKIEAKGSAPGPVAPGNGSGSTPAGSPSRDGGANRPGVTLGGLLGRGKRADGLPAGSGAAQVADSEKERLRKAIYRASKKQAESPPVLPPPVAKPGQPASPAGAQASTVSGSAPVNGMAAVPPGPGDVSAPIVLWTGPDLAPVTDAAVPLMEEVLHTQKLQKLRSAKIAPETIKQIEKDFEWPGQSKAMLSKTGAALGAKYLNKIGVNAVYKDEVNFGMALLLILKKEAATNRRLDKLIAAAEKTAGPATSAPAVKAPAPLTVSGQAVPAAAALFPTDVEPGGTPTAKK